MDEEQARGDPEGESEGRAELGEHVVRDDEFAEGGDILDCAVAALGGGVGGGEDGGAGGGVGGGGVQADHGGVVGGVQHDPAAGDGAAAAGLEEARHAAVVGGEVEFPGCEEVVEFAVLALPFLDVGEGGDVDGFFEELVDPREDPEDLDVVGEGAEVLGGRGGGEFGGGVGVEPAGFDWDVFVPEIVAAGELAVDFFLVEGEFEGGRDGGVAVEEVDHPDEAAAGFVFDPVFCVGEDHGSEGVDGLVVGRY
ncbi:hypothetical protein V500_06102 [Pseudogymnoascus sp. VKM F-4518 (FW-2643)]|nr:hypothetical protein V500_06102 [Pseudogymnoascus sp. VKM F-4518 (FW-2643)]